MGMEDLQLKKGDKLLDNRCKIYIKVKKIKDKVIF